MTQTERRPGDFFPRERITIVLDKPHLTEVTENDFAYDKALATVLTDPFAYEIDRTPLYRRYDVELDTGERRQFLGWQMKLVTE